MCIARMDLFIEFYEINKETRSDDLIKKAKKKIKDRHRHTTIENFTQSNKK